jgi:hypothetical protein
VHRSTAVDDDGSIMWEVREHIREHDLVAGDRVTKKSTDWMFGEVEITWYMSQTKRREGLASHKDRTPCSGCWTGQTGKP